MKSVVVAIALSVASGCSHVMTIESEPPGAAVLVEGKRVGTTPMTFDEQTGRDDLVSIELQQGARSARFAYQKTAISTEAAMGAVGGACGMCALGTTTLVGLGVALPLVFGGGVADPATVFAAIIAVYAGYIVGVTMIGYAPYVVVIGIGEGARKGPDKIYVDFTAAPAPEVQSTPAGMTVPMLGRSLPSSTEPSAAPPQAY